MIRRYSFSVYVTGDGMTPDEAWKDAKTKQGLLHWDDSSEICVVCAFPVDLAGEDCMCDDAVHGDKVAILDDPTEFRYVFDQGKGEGNYETPESIRKIRDKGGVRFIDE